MGALQQRRGRGRMFREHADAHAHSGHHLKPFGRIPGLCHRSNQLARQRCRAIGMAQVARHHGQFVPRHAAQQVARPHGSLHPARNVLEHQVANGMAIAVVHILEPVQVELQHGHAFAAAARLHHRVFELLAKPQAVGQPGERIVVGQKLQALVLRLLAGNIGEHAHIVRWRAGRVARHTQRHVLGKHLTVLAPVPDFTLPAPGALH